MPTQQTINLACAKQADDKMIESMEELASRSPALIHSSSFRFIHWRLGWEDGTSDQFEITFSKEGTSWIALQYDAINATMRETGEENFKKAGRAIVEAGFPLVVMTTEGYYGRASTIYTHLARVRSIDQRYGAKDGPVQNEVSERAQIFVPASQLTSWFEKR